MIHPVYDAVCFGTIEVNTERLTANHNAETRYDLVQKIMMVYVPVWWLFLLHDNL